jgi:predicted N-acetyltransferase YhbS
MDDETEIRPAAANDADAIRRLLIEFGYEAGDLAHVDDRLRAKQLEPGPCVFVCERNGDVIAVGSINITDVLERPAPQARVGILIVRPAERGRGVGRALVAQLERAARDSGCSRIDLTSAHTLTEAHAFWTALGYQQTGARFAKTLAEESAWPSRADTST